MREGREGGGRERGEEEYLTHEILCSGFEVALLGTQTQMFRPPPPIKSMPTPIKKTDARILAENHEKNFQEFRNLILGSKMRKKIKMWQKVGFCELCSVIDCCP